jgi:hypothetical protein
MDNRILKVEKILSFKPDQQASNYTLNEVEDSVKSRFIELICKLERSPQVYLCLRGDSKIDINGHNKFFNEDLSKLFIVGAKALSSIEMTTEPKYQHFVSDTGKTLSDIKKLVDEINDKLLDKSQSPRVSGRIPRSFIDSITYFDEEELGKWKIFFLSFLHNSGRLNLFKDHSPFISLTYGPNKYTISRRFATELCKHKKGILFLYCLNAGWPYYIKTIDFGNYLRKFGVKWYPDINSEIMLLDGMYPHYLLGVYEVEPFRNPKFVVNPWLYNMFLKNQNFDYSKGIPIDQTYFHTFAEKLGYKNYSFHYFNENVEFASELNQRNHYKIIRPRV